MGLARINVEVELTEINCGECGGTYAINERYRLQAYQKGTSWTCPYCQVGWGYRGNSENDKLKRQLEKERKRREWAEQETKNTENRLRAQKAATTRIKNRVGAGVCPCCNKTFKQLARHMRSKHPNYASTTKFLPEEKHN